MILITKSNNSVISISEDCRIDIKCGDKVIYKSYSGLHRDGTLELKESDIVAIIN